MEKFLMACFDVYSNPSSHATSTPYLLDVQTDLLKGLDSRMVIPLRSMKSFPNVKLSTRLTPILTINGEDCLLETPKMASVPKHILNAPLTSLAHIRDQITDSIDFLVLGY